VGSGEVSSGEKMLYSGTDPKSYITEYTLVYEEFVEKPKSPQVRQDPPSKKTTVEFCIPSKLGRGTSRCRVWGFGFGVWGFGFGFGGLGVCGFGGAPKWTDRVFFSSL